ncbi:MAG: glycosyltransferase, partial [Lachnospiraceae bacterium]|nr:glycosyltransferase [Lachnospiraceae bacterium]
NTCLRSIIAQNFSDMEILLIDDGSTDGSGRICQEFAGQDKRITYIRQKNAGANAARRTGLENACGDFIMFVDSDDWIDDGMAEFLIDQIGDADMATTGVHYETGPGMVVEYPDKYPEGKYGGRDKEYLLKTMLYDADSDTLQRLTPWIWNKLYRTEIVRQIFRTTDCDIDFAEDAAFLYNYLIISGSVRICHQSFYHYRYRTDSMFHGGNPHMLSDINKAYLALLPGFEKHPLRDSLMSQLQRWVTVTAVMAVNGGMGFTSGIQIPEFLLDTDGLTDKKIVLYGAGKAGKDYFGQLTKMGYNVVLWVDSNKSEMEYVKQPRAILETEYDVILLAVSRPEYAESIKQSLKDIGIGEEKVMWKRPVRAL